MHGVLYFFGKVFEMGPSECELRAVGVSKFYDFRANLGMIHTIHPPISFADLHISDWSWDHNRKLHQHGSWVKCFYCSGDLA